MPCRMRRMMLIAASWPSKRAAAVTKRTLLAGRYWASALASADRSVMGVVSGVGGILLSWRAAGEIGCGQPRWRFLPALADEAMEKDTVSMHFVRAAVARLGRVERARVLAQAGIAEPLLDAAQGRVPAHAFSALWLAVSREIDDEFFGLDRRRMKVGSFALL